MFKYWLIYFIFYFIFYNITLLFTWLDFIIYFTYI